MAASAESVPDADRLGHASTDELLAWLEQARTSDEAGRVAMRLLGKLVSAPPTRRWTLAELPPDAPRILGAIARSELAAGSGDLWLALDGCGLPRDRGALARFADPAIAGPEEHTVQLDGRPLPLWKLVDAVVHDGVPVERAAAALASADDDVVARGLTALVFARHVPITRLAQANEPVDPVRDEEERRRNVRVLAELAPEASIASLEADARTLRDPRAAAVVVLRRKDRARDEVLVAALAPRSPYASDLAHVVAGLPLERREPLVLAAVPIPVAAHVEPTELELQWLASTPTPRTAERLLDFARAWRRRRGRVPWEALAAALHRMGEPGASAARTARAELPRAFNDAVSGAGTPPRPR